MVFMMVGKEICIVCGVCGGSVSDFYDYDLEGFVYVVLDNNEGIKEVFEY